MQIDDKVVSLISNGSEIAGPAIGGAVGFLTGGPAGAAAGGALGAIAPKAIRKLLADITNRTLSKREQIRVGATAAFALEKIKSYMDSGKAPRNDGFFSSNETERPNAEEIFEGVLLKSKNEHEEKKTKIFGNIFANIVFMPEFSVGESNHLLQLAESLTYRKMCLLSLFERRYSIHGLKLRDNDYRDYREQVPYETISILQEVYDLYLLGMLVCATSESGYEALLGLADVRPDRMLLTELGTRYYEIMGLQDIPIEDLLEVVKFISQ